LNCTVATIYAYTSSRPASIEQQHFLHKGQLRPILSQQLCPSLFSCLQWVLHLQDEATVKELRAEEVTGGVKGWMQRAYTELIQPDLFEDVPSSDTLMRIHSTAEEFDASAEELWAPFQVNSVSGR